MPYKLEHIVPLAAKAIIEGGQKPYRVSQVYHLQDGRHCIYIMDNASFSQSVASWSNAEERHQTEAQLIAYAKALAENAVRSLDNHIADMQRNRVPPPPLEIRWEQMDLPQQQVAALPADNVVDVDFGD